MVVVTLYKIAVCLAYLRLLGQAMVGMRRFVLSVLAFVIISDLLCTMVITFQCHPPNRSWQPWVEGSCLANYSTRNVHTLFWFKPWCSVFVIRARKIQSALVHDH
jgi:hypothetical protein